MRPKHPCQRLWHGWGIRNPPGFFAEDWSGLGRGKVEMKGFSQLCESGPSAGLPGWRITQDHAPGPHFAVRRQEHVDWSMNAGSRGMNGAGSISSVVLLEVNATVSHWLVRRARPIG